LEYVIATFLAAEREAIVAWIRKQSSDGWFNVLDAADGIECGEHRKPEPK
jgi:hypothetical protein